MKVLKLQIKSSYLWYLCLQQYLCSQKWKLFFRFYWLPLGALHLSLSLLCLDGFTTEMEGGQAYLTSPAKAEISLGDDKLLA